MIKKFPKLFPNKSSDLKVFIDCLWKVADSRGQKLFPEGTQQDSAQLFRYILNSLKREYVEVTKFYSEDFDNFRLRNSSNPQINHVISSHALLTNPTVHVVHTISDTINCNRCDWELCANEVNDEVIILPLLATDA